MGLGNPEHQFIKLPPPAQPRKRGNNGFGAPSIARTATHSTISPFLVIHLAWNFFSSRDRQRLTAAHPILDSYAKRRVRALLHYSAIHLHLRSPRPPIAMITPLCHVRAEFLGCALLLFNFRYGDLLRWMGHTYMCSHRDFVKLYAAYEAVRYMAPNPGEPSPDFERAFRAQAEGVPLEGHFVGSFSDTVKRMAYNNHAPLHAALAEVRVKLGKEEAKCYHVALPRSVAYFIDGLFIAFMSWVIQKGKGRIVVDPSTPLDKTDRGNLNAHIPKPGIQGSLDRNPRITYANAFVRHLIHLWNLRITNPRAEILQHTDDIEAAFHRIHYHPDLGICYAYVFEEFLIILVGMIFGSGDSPSWFGTTAEPRTHMGATRDYSNIKLPVADSVQLPPPPTETEIATFVQAVADTEHQGITPEFANRFWHAMFVDDNAVADTYERFTAAVRSAEGSAYENYGSPEHDPRGPVLPLDKFVLVALTCILHLGLLVDSRLMAVAWPLEKLERLREVLDDWLNEPRQRTAQEVARLLGLVRHGAQLSNTGPFWSIRLQRQLSAVTSSTAAAKMHKKHWWKWKRLKIDPTVMRDLDLLRQTLPPADATDTDPFHYWSRPIGLMIPREPNVVALSDASYSGLGGWSPTWNFMWRLTRDDLIAFSFDMRQIDQAGEDLLMYERDHPDALRGLHINVLELIAIIVNTWIILKRMQSLEAPVGGWIVSILADNTSALSWFHYAARNHRSIIVQNLTMFCQALISLSHTDHLVRFQGSHIPGVTNDEADALSRPTIHPSVASVTRAYSRLQTCQFLLLPSGLLSTLGKITSWRSTEAALVSETTQLLTAGLRSLPAGSPLTASTPNYYKRLTRRSSRR
jgi:hypothetical protein